MFVFHWPGVWPRSKCFSNDSSFSPQSVTLSVSARNHEALERTGFSRCPRSRFVSRPAGFVPQESDFRVLIRNYPNTLQNSASPCFSRMKDTCYPDIPDPYKSSVRSLLKPKVNVGKCMETMRLLDPSPGRGCANHTSQPSPGRRNRAGEAACVLQPWNGAAASMSSTRGHPVNLQLTETRREREERSSACLPRTCHPR